LTLKSNIGHSPVQLGKPTEPQMIDVPITVEDASRMMMLRQSILHVDRGGKDVCGIDGGGGLGSDLILFTYAHTDGEKRMGGFHLAPVLADWIEKVDPKAPAELLKTLRGQS
jgi:hypothetical protein